MNNFQYKIAMRCLSSTEISKLKYKKDEEEFLVDIVTEHRMTDGASLLTRKQNNWLSQLGERR